MSLREFQELMRKLYFARDNARGIGRTFMWLVEEVGELARAIRDGDHELMESEFADVLAWLSSLANLVGVDLEKAAFSKYKDVCPRCKKSPCVCPFREG
ncbi:MAG: nucleotide pyrophosphohydrolase [Candidatus Methanomethylicota archaeon]|uniref:Nucleotide pyrophosphohydrolase n=1 Tax=Thermoproteota archaeon TaxID=2056631 RepID=A0A497F991_9CREN|nr:MAG: nucleotide pyrophosphohydrolase [Candidatus Verstraetearchaeota archaeon]